MPKQEKFMQNQIDRMNKSQVQCLPNRQWRLIVLSLVLTGMMLLSFNCPAYSADSDSDNKQEITLNDLQDAGILLRYIRRQAINIYVEADRAKLTPTSSPKIPEVEEIPVKVQPKDVLPPRRQWVLLYLTAIEPVVRELGTEITNTQEGLNPIIPADLKKSLEPLWQEWADNVKGLNQDLDELLPLVDDAPHNNQQIRDVAVKIFDHTNKLENVRRQVFVVLAHVERFKPDKKVLINPVD